MRPRGSGCLRERATGSLDVGDPNEVISRGQRYEDAETGNIVYVYRNRVVIVDTETNAPLSQFKNSRRNTLSRIARARWRPAPLGGNAEPTETFESGDGKAKP